MNDLKTLSFIKNQRSHREEFFLEMENDAKKHFIPIIKPETASFLEGFCKALKPTKILEIGTAIGYSSMVMASSLHHHVLIDTVEISLERVKQARKNIKEYGFSDCIRVIYGDAEDVLKNLDKEYELIFLDGAKGQYNRLFSLCENLLCQNGVVITDNIFLGGLFFDLEVIGRKKRTMVRNMNLFMEKARKNSPSFSLIPLGDGLLVYVKED